LIPSSCRDKMPKLSSFDIGLAVEAKVPDEQRQLSIMLRQQERDWLLQNPREVSRIH
jgi:hypothetical protein